jgi:hypothetical protein
MRSRATSTRASGVSRRTAVAAAISALFLETFTGAAGPLSAHTSDSGHSYANSANYGNATGLANFTLDGSGNLTTGGAEGTALVVGLAMPETNSTTFVMNFPAYSNMWFDIYMNALADQSYRIYFDHVFSDANTLEIGGMVVGNSTMRANGFGAPWHVPIDFGVDMTFRYDVSPTKVELFVDDVSVGSLNYIAGSVSAAGTLILDGDIQGNLLLRSVEVTQP